MLVYSMNSRRNKSVLFYVLCFHPLHFEFLTHCPFPDSVLNRKIITVSHPNISSEFTEVAKTSRNVQFNIQSWYSNTYEPSLYDYIVVQYSPWTELHCNLQEHNISVHIYDNSLELYKTAASWQNFYSPVVIEANRTTTWWYVIRHFRETQCKGFHPV